MTAKPSSELNPVVRRFIEDGGSTTQAFGLGRVVGQIYAYLYFAQTPKNLADLQAALGISKGSASMGVRQLEAWEAVRKVWVKGDRKDYYEANIWFGRILRNALVDTVAQKMSAYTALLEDAREQLADSASRDGADAAHLRARLDHLRTFHDRARSAWNNPLLQRLLR